MNNGAPAPEDRCTDNTNTAIATSSATPPVAGLWENGANRWLEDWVDAPLAEMPPPVPIHAQQTTQGLMVEYDTPLDLDAITVGSSHNQPDRTAKHLASIYASQKRHESTSMAHSSLPSPAPSEDRAAHASPRLPTQMLPRQGPGPVTRQPYFPSAPRTTQNAQSPTAFASPQLQQRESFSIPGHSSPPVVHQPMPSPQLQHQGSFPGSGHFSPQVMQQPMLPSQLQLQRRLQSQHVAGRQRPKPRNSAPRNAGPVLPSQRLPEAAQSKIPFDLAVLRQRLEEQIILTTPTQQLRGNTYFQAGQGRLNLLIQAVDNNDFFYLALSQIVCLRTTNAQYLPGSIKSIPDACFTALDELLSSNTNVDPRVLEFCATFPEPTMFFYANPQMPDLQNTYASAVEKVSTFLKLLGQHWVDMKTNCVARQCPPLIQDMKDLLALHSRTLWSVVFRAISRDLLMQSSHSDVGVQVLEYLHHIDVQIPGRRNDVQKQRAYEAISALIRSISNAGRELTSWQMANPGIPVASAPLLSGVLPHVLTMFDPRSRPPISPAPLTPVRMHRGANPQQQGQRDANGQTTSRMQLPNANVQMAKDPRYFFPRENAPAPAQPADPDTMRIALHHAHIRSPELGTRGAAVPATNLKLYRQVCGLAVWPPQQLRPELLSQSIHFTLSPEDFAQLSETVFNYGRIERRSEEGSIAYRLRCAKTDKSAVGWESESAWIEADNIWPSNTFFTMDDMNLEPRRKLQYGKYLPIDLTTHLKVGLNTITILYNRLESQAKEPFNFAVAVEKVEVVSHEAILNSLATISAEDSLAAIKKSLDSSTNNDDELSIVSTTMTLNIRNPMTLLIFDIPVRSSRCQHRDCFDLGTYLMLAKCEDPAWPSIVDTWKCPICRGDARPSLLIKDGFFIEVREELAKRDLLSTEVIIVEADGRWRPKEAEKKTGVRSAILEREEAAVAASALATVKGMAKRKRAPMVVEIDDD